MMKYKAVLFDMDGTILDTITDLRMTLNRILEKNGHMHHYTDEQVKMLFGSGIVVALTRALAIENGFDWQNVDQITQIDSEKSAEITMMAAQWKQDYDKHASDHTRPYEGIVQLCQELKNDGVIIGVLSNKPDPAVQQLSREYFENMFDLIIGENDQIQKKPAPDMIYKAYRQFSLQPEEVCYVGDTEIDIQTAENAGCDIISVTWGFRNRQYLQMHRGRGYASNVEELRKLLYQDSI